MTNFLMLAYPKPMVASGKTSNCGPAYAGGVFSLWHVGAKEAALAAALQSVRLGVCIVAIFCRGRVDEPASRGAGRQAGTIRLIISEYGAYGANHKGADRQQVGQRISEQYNNTSGK